jgi:hypothetical protein
VSRICVDTEYLRQVGRRLIAEGDCLAGIGHELRGAANSLDTGAWDGVSRGRVDWLLGYVRLESERVAEGLDRLGRRSLHVAEVFEREDNTAAQDLAGLPWVEWDGGGGGVSTGRAPGLAAMRSVQGGAPPWERGGFGWWAAAFEEEHARPPTEEDYREFLLSWELSGEGQVQWTDEDWEAFYYARQAGLERWMALGMIVGPMSGVQILAAVEALNAASEPTPTPDTATPTPTPGPWDSLHSEWELWLLGFPYDDSGNITQEHIQAQNQYNQLIWETVGEVFGEGDQRYIAGLVKRQIARESQFDPAMQSSSGAVGLMQLTEAAVTEVVREGSMSAVDPLDPEQNVEAGVEYLKWLYDRIGSYEGSYGWRTSDEDRWRFTLASYNAGLGAIKQRRLDSEQPELWSSVEGRVPLETQEYVRDIFNFGENPAR